MNSGKVLLMIMYIRSYVVILVNILTMVALHTIHLVCFALYWR